MHLLPDLVMPAEWAEHRATLMCWPANRELWGDNYQDALNAYELLVRTIKKFEPVRLIVAPRDYPGVYRRLEDAEPRVELIPIQIDDAWVRDNGPIYVRDMNGSQVVVRWKFNAWGQKHANYDNDARLPLVLARRDNIDLVEAPLVLEGGGISVDGEGTLLTTESVILNRNRNPGLTKREAELCFKRFFGARKVIWLPEGLQGDETDGHIDNLASFVSPGVIVALSCKDTTDANYGILMENISILQHETDARGNYFKIIEIEQPDPIYLNRKRLTASYVNFYFVNDGLVFPVFGQTKDAKALAIIKEIVGDHRSVAPVRADILISGGGGIHCMTQQWPT